MSLTTRINIGFEAYLTATAGLNTASDPLRKFVQCNLEDGTAANQANQLYTLSGTIGISSVSVVDLISTLTLNAFGVALAYTKAKAVFIRNTHATQAFTVSTTIVGGPTGVIRPGGVLVLTAPDFAALAVTAGADSITLTNGTGSITTYEIAVVGVQ